MAIIFPHHLPCTLGKPKKNPKESQETSQEKPKGTSLILELR